MKIKKMIAYFLGGTGSVAILTGILMLLAPKAFSIATAIVIICLSLAIGIMIPNPISTVGFFAGICMLVFPARIVGLILLAGGMVAVILNPFLMKKEPVRG